MWGDYVANPKIGIFIRCAVVALAVTAMLVYLVAFSRPPIDQASPTQLEQIDGIGPIKAQRIIEYLKRNPGADIEDLDEVEGIGPVIVDRLEKEWR